MGLVYLVPTPSRVDAHVPEHQPAMSGVGAVQARCRTPSASETEGPALTGHWDIWDLTAQTMLTVAEHVDHDARWDVPH